MLEIIIAIQNEGSSLKLIIANLDSQSALLPFMRDLTSDPRTSSKTSAHLRRSILFLVKVVCVSRNEELKTWSCSPSFESALPHMYNSLSGFLIIWDLAQLFDLIYTNCRTRYANRSMFRDLLVGLKTLITLVPVDVHPEKFASIVNLLYSAMTCISEYFTSIFLVEH